MESASRRAEKRNRPPVSCEPCRTRKLKCSQGLPCESCLKRNKEAFCHYAVNANRNKPAVASKEARLMEKLKSLEDTVSSLLRQEAAAESPPHFRKQHATKEAPSDLMSSSTARLPKEEVLENESPRALLGRDGQITYVDASHWQSILEEVREVREHLSSSESSVPHDLASDSKAAAEPDPAFAFGQLASLDINDILTSLPPQPICDNLLVHYFNSQYANFGFIHPDKFRTEYERFWAAPQKTPVLWTALLFALLGLTSTLRQIANQPADNLPPAKVFQQRTMQCLILGHYATANAHALEAMLIHLQSCFISDANSHVELWFKMGTAIQLAFRMGYHRDPIVLSGISPFDGEMRRRVWLNIFQIDALMSFQMGFPSMIPTEYCDTKLPGNHEYNDLQVDMPAIPPARPLSHRTPVLYIISKAPVMHVFKKIIAHTQSLAPTTYDRTVTLDLEMREAYSLLPDKMKRRDVNQSFMDSSSLIWERCTIELLYLKGLVVLHRRYLRHEPGNPKFAPSRRSCVEAAMEILGRQADISQASQPGGRLHEDRWMLSSLTVHDFLLAALVLCLDLSVRADAKVAASIGERREDNLASREYSALQVSHQIWTAGSEFSHQARTACRALELMMKTVPRTSELQSHPQNPTPEASIASAPGISELPYAEPMLDMIDGSEALDWPLLDQYFQNQSVDVDVLNSWDAGPEVLFNQFDLA